VQCHIVPVIGYAIYYTVARTEHPTVTILDVAYGPQIEWAETQAA
jgi:hypothetical protein